MPETRKEIKTPVKIGFRDNSLSTVRKLVRRESARKASEHPPIAMDSWFYQVTKAEPNRAPLFPNQEQILVFGAAPVLHFNDWRYDFGTTPMCVGVAPVPQDEMHGLGFGFLSPVFNYPHPGQDRFTTPFGLPGTDRIRPMGGGTTVFRVASNDDFCSLSNASKLITLPAGRMTVWTQGFFLGPDGDRKYFILDIGEKFRLYYEFEAGVTSRLVFVPNADHSFKITMDLGFDDLRNWFAPGPRKLVLIWDYSEQLFELYYNDMRGEGEPIEYIPMPLITDAGLTLGNSSGGSFDDPNAGLENAYQHFDEWTFARLPAGIFEASAVDGHVAQSLIPLHDGPHREWGDPCVTPYALTPINLGSAACPFDEIYARTIHEACRGVAITGEPTGFPNLTDSTLTFTDGTRLFEIDPTGATFDYYIAGQQFTSSGDDITITDVEGLHWIYYDGYTLMESVNPDHDTEMDLIRHHALVSIIYWDATNNLGIYVQEERHGLTMDGDTHSNLHETHGLQWLHDLALTTFSVDQDGSLAAHAQFGVEAGDVLDEDIHYGIDAILSTAGLNIYYRNGIAGDWRRTTEAGFACKTTGTGRLGWNAFLVVWRIAEVTNTNFVLYHIFASTEKDNPMLSIMGQNEYNTKKAARDGAEKEISDLLLGNLPTPELRPIGTVIFECKNAYLNAVNARIVSTTEGGDYVDWRTIEALRGGPVVDHSVFVRGPALATDNAIARYDGTTGKLIQDSGVLIDDADNMLLPGDLQGGVSHCVNYDITIAANTEGILARRSWQDETVNPPYLLRPDVPRTIYVTTLPEIPGITTMTGTVTINGIDADGAVIADVITVNTNIFFIYETNYAFALITSIVVDQTDATLFSEYAVGMGDKLGLPNYPFNAAGDVFKVNLGGIDFIVPAVDATYGTVDLAVIPIPVTAIFWYRPFM